MKYTISILLLVTITIQSFGQHNAKHQLLYKKQVDSIMQINKQNKIYLDTLWVLDSSLYYQIIYSPTEFTHAKTYKVLSRNENGNTLTSSDLVSNTYPGNYLNNDYDSIIYFDGTQIKKHYSNVWNSVEQVWIYNEYKEYEIPNLPKEIFHKNFWDGIQQYNGWRELYENENGKVVTFVFETYVPETDSWHPKSKTVYYYDEQRNDTLQMIYSWNNNNWVDSVKYQQYFEYNLLTEKIGQIIDTATSTWKNYAYFSYTYTFDNKVDTAIFKMWNTQNNIWQDNFKTIFTYDDQNRLTNRLQLVYSSVTQQLENNNNYNVDYKEGNKTELYQTWIMPDGPWSNQRQYYTSFITEEIVDTLQYDTWDSYTHQWHGNDRTVNIFDNRFNVLESTQYYLLNDEWQYSTKTDYYWSPFFPNSITEISVNAITAYPNPASSRVSFVLKELTSYQSKRASVVIYNLSGQKVGEFTMVDGKFQWDCSSEKPGLYIYSTIIEEVNHTGKIVVNH